MTISEEEKSSNVVSILSALAALADSAPDVFASTERGKKAMKFALETILMGRGDSGSGEFSDHDEDAIEDSGDEADNSRAKSGRSSPAKRVSNKRGHIEVRTTASLVEDENLSIPCRRICAAIDFVVSYVRSAILSRRRSSSSIEGISPDFLDQARQSFSLLTQILSDNGLPPSNRDRRACKSRWDRAALRQSAATNLLRLCDPRLGLEKKYLSLSMWHTLGEAFLDEELSVRKAVLEEYANLLEGKNSYGEEVSHVKPGPPGLRFVALIALCSDGDHGQDHDAANGNAANVGKLVPTKRASLACVNKLRNMCDNIYARCRAEGRAGEQKFAGLKYQYLPEYMVPYAFHLLSHRRESPCEEANSEGQDGGTTPTAVDYESQHRVLRRRLKLLFEPLVQSLGESADNISFLLRTTEILGKKHYPVDATPTSSKALSSSMELSIGSDSSMDTKPQADSKRLHLLQVRLKAICVASREVLLTFVKKDVNLAQYPGVINIPLSLFRASNVLSKRPSPSGLDLLSSQETNQSFSLESSNKKQKLSQGSPSPLDKNREGVNRSKSPLPRDSVRSRSPQPTSSSSKTRVHFSPEVQFRSSAHCASPGGDHGGRQFGGVSPIPKSKSPGSAKRSSLQRHTDSSPSAGSTPSDDTLGTTPPSALRGATMISTAPDNPTTDPKVPSSAALSSQDTNDSAGPRKTRSQSQTQDSVSTKASAEVPTHIKISRPSKRAKASASEQGSIGGKKGRKQRDNSRSKAKPENEFDFEASEGPENRRPRGKKPDHSAGSVVKAGSSTTKASKKRSVASRQLRRRG